MEVVEAFASSPWFALGSNGSLYVFLRQRPERHLSLARFDDGNAAGAGLVILEGARLDLSRIGGSQAASTAALVNVPRKTVGERPV